MHDIVMRVDYTLSHTQLPWFDKQIRERIMSLEGWLFGKKVIYLNREQPYYEQVADNSQYLFGERVRK